MFDSVQQYTPGSDIRALADEALHRVELSRLSYLANEDAGLIAALDKLAEGLKVAADRIDALERKGRRWPRLIWDG